MIQRYLYILLVLFLFSPLVGAEISREELERWFESDEFVPPRDTAADVNEGQLVFIKPRPGQGIHHHHNALKISDSSLINGWIRIHQCHENIDKVPAIQIVFNKDRVKDLKLISKRNIESAWIEGASVQMTNVSANAQICIEASTQALLINKDGSYTLRNGPFMRRFLDGYYPMRVSMHIDFSNTPLQWVSASPAEQAGFVVSKKQQQLDLDAWFEGRLITEFRFTKKSL